MDVICDGCGRRNPASRRFCQQCGRYLSPDLERVPPEPVAGQPRPVPTTGAAVTGVPGPGPADAVGAPVAAPAPQLADGESPCPACGTGNPPERQFCRHCGHALRSGAPAFAAPTTTTSKASWWTRFKAWWARLRERWTWGASRASRSRYRASLPSRYWLVRLGIPVSLFGLVSAFMLWTHGDPIGWTRDRYHDIRGTVEPLDVTGAVSLGKDEEDVARFVHDASSTNYWTTPWSQEIQDGVGSASTVCTDPVPKARGLEITFEENDSLKGLRLLTGTGEDEAQWLPTRIRIRFADDNCVYRDLDATQESQDVSFDTVSSDSIAISIIEAEPRSNTPGTTLAIRSVEPLARPE